MGKIGAVEILAVMVLIILPLSILIIASMWKLYTKANKPGWAAIIPIYNTLIMLEIIRKPWWWLLLMLIPFVNIVIYIWSINLFVKSYGKDEGFTIGVLLLPYLFYPMLAFNKNTRYIHDRANEVHDIGVREE
jgi:hypothetical protein